MTKEIIIKALLEHDYPEKQAQSVANELQNVSSPLMPLLQGWIDNGEEYDYSAEGISILGLKKKFNMTYPAALLSVDWVLKEPETAIKAISRGIR